MIVYTPFWETMKKRGVTTYAMIHKLGVANGTLYRMRQGKPITTETINQLCRVLGCRTQDVILYVEEDDQ